MIIYLILNLINGKMYIGQTKFSLMKRWKNHIAHSRDGRDTYFANTIKKYGSKSFWLFTIEENLSLEEANEREEFWIKYYDTCNKTHGYNLQSGGKNRFHSEESKLKIGEKSKGRKHTEDFKIYISERMKENKHSLGNITSEETKIKLSEALKDRKFSKEHREKLSISRKKQIPPMLGKTTLEETKIKIREKAVGRKRYIDEFGKTRYKSRDLNL